MFYYKYLASLAALAATGGFVYMARKPENAAFHFFNQDAFVACCLANTLLAAPFFLARMQIAKGSTLMFSILWILGIVIYIGIGAYNLRRTRPVFGVIATLAQIAVFSVAFPILISWSVLKLVGSIFSAIGPPDGYDSVNDPDQLFGVSDDERRKEGLYSPEKMTPKSF